jgi:hypothetical protein
MGSSYAERSISESRCERCPSRKGMAFRGELRGSSYRGRLIPEGEQFETGHCVLMVGSVLVANVMIANAIGDTPAAEHDADFIQAEFENNVGKCSKPTTELTPHGVEVLCTPVNLAVNEFMRVNYPSTGSE